MIQNRMFSRALLLLLLVLNVGVAAWWLLRPEPLPVVDVLPPAAPRLQLVGETTAAAGKPAASATASAARAAVPASTSMPSAPASVPATAPGTTATAMRCLRLGPFASDAALAHAQSTLQPRVARMAVATSIQRVTTPIASACAAKPAACSCAIRRRAASSLP